MTDTEDRTDSYAYTVKNLSSNSVQVDYCEFIQRDGSIVLDSEHMKNYVITFNGDNSGAIDNCNGITTISKIDSTGKVTSEYIVSNSYL